MNYTLLRKPQCRSSYFNLSPLKKCWYGREMTDNQFIEAMNCPDEILKEFDENYCYICGHELAEKTNRIILQNGGYSHRECYIE